MKLKLLTSAAAISVPLMIPHTGLAEGDAVWNTKGAVWTTEERSVGIEDGRLRTCEADESTGIGELVWKAEAGEFESVSALQFRITMQGYDEISFTTDRKLHSDDGETLDIDKLTMARPEITNLTGAFADFPFDDLLPTPGYGTNPEQTTLMTETLRFFNGEEGGADVTLAFRIEPKLNSPEQLSEILEKRWTFTVNLNCYDGADADA